MTIVSDQTILRDRFFWIKNNYSDFQLTDWLGLLFALE